MNLPADATRSEDSADIVELLLDCHARIRYFADLAGKLGALPELSADDVRTGAARVRRYFAEALPLHVADEEESVRPRLHGRGAALDAALERMSAEHEEHGPGLAALLSLCERLEAEPALHEALRGELVQTAAALERDFAVHLAQEEAVVLPAIRRLLSAAERAAMAGELRARRQRQWRG